MKGSRYGTKSFLLLQSEVTIIIFAATNPINLRKEKLRTQDSKTKTKMQNESA